MNVADINKHLCRGHCRKNEKESERRARSIGKELDLLSPTHRSKALKADSTHEGLLFVEAARP